MKKYAIIMIVALVIIAVFVGAIVSFLSKGHFLPNNSNYQSNTPIPLVKDVVVDLKFDSMSSVTINLYNAGKESFKFQKIIVDSVSTRFSKDIEITELANGQTFNLTVEHYWRPNIQY